MTPDHTFEEVRYTDRCKCPTCGEWFNSTYAFDSHRIGRPTDRRCLTTDEMVQRGMTVSEAGYWITGAMSSEAKAVRQGADNSPEGTP